MCHSPRCGGASGNNTGTGAFWAIVRKVKCVGDNKRYEWDWETARESRSQIYPGRMGEQLGVSEDHLICNLLGQSKEAVRW